MYTPSILVGLLALSPLVVAHGKIAVLTGDLGGNGTALGIKGAVVPGAGPNSKTEIDTTVFNIGNNNCGRTEAGGRNQAETGVTKAMALSGSTLPQISTDNPSISGTFHIVTSDGAGPLTAMVDPTGKGDFSQAVKAEITTQIPGVNGNIRKSKQTRWNRVLRSLGLSKRATNINENFPFSVAIPAGTTCTGTIAGQSNVCMVKIVNPSNAGPFGGCVAVQQSTGTNSTAASGKKVKPVKFSV
ncbi:hypothetical protein SS1G_04934 [Sclerotinia sclerotiorum 1980 UF-70]|uniref:Cell surface protein n=2 Tax=Sclerotinia sclerotiorum (strain ATCC 18683 / 1980 / Ss-1) TaxID=665079 RepID=A7EHZ2_SCLS1|nr:hypothetical protein SS1G_04934 [Sclerotinia sclerotiorum 1980 UF-70]APA11522.1 hypothetical protein sscle_08g062920 [Sclerotinia sclerotiorum 1980 UF-70]EDO02458.1 hypothetical protein SS1G_04934 [Sclerotinia sclerotiorum 1980 UF-70]